MKAKQFPMVAWPLLGVVVLALAAGLLYIGKDGAERARLTGDDECASRVSNLRDLLALPATALGRVDIARLNLSCAQGLAGGDDLDVSRSLALLEEMAARVRSETDRHLYRFQSDPDQFEHSEGLFRMIMLAVVLGEDFGVKYAPTKRGTAAEARIGDGFFADAHDVFLHGLTGDRRLGTCSSLPVLQVAVGRRLGYPLKLVTTKGHLFVRWEDARERFNVEAAGRGVSRFPDDYYRHWPVEVSDEEIQAEGYLKSLTPHEELAVFLSIRGMCLRETGSARGAAESFRDAARLAPECRGYQRMVATLEVRVAQEESAGVFEPGARAEAAER